MTGGKRYVGKVFLAAAVAPLFAVYGAWVVVTSLIGLVRRMRWTMRLLHSTRLCPSCGSPNSMYGRWQCQSPGCGIVYHGAVDCCPRCASGAGYFACRDCQVSILLGSAR